MMIAARLAGGNLFFAFFVVGDFLVGDFVVGGFFFLGGGGVCFGL